MSLTDQDKFDQQLYASGLTAQGCWDELDDYAKCAILRFGELIVRQCASVGYDASYYECAVNVDNKIKEHFGVK